MSGIESFVTAFRDAWNSHDANRLAQLWVADGELNHPWGVRAVGRDAILELLAREHTGAMAESRLSVTRMESREDGDRGEFELDGILEGVLAPNGRPYDLPHRVAALMTRVGDEWLIRTMTPLANPR